MADDVLLGERLIAAALRRLDTQPAESLSLRRVAEDVGVSHQAPYVHFGDKRTFLAAVAGTGLARAAADAAAAVARAGDEPRGRLHALVEAYVDFIHASPHLHDLAYGPLVAKSDHPRLQAAAIVFWDLLHDTVAACQHAGTDEGEVLRRCTAAWGTVYGIARLRAHGQIPASVPAGPTDVLHEAVDTLYDGWRAAQPDRV